MARKLVWSQQGQLNAASGNSIVVAIPAVVKLAPAPQVIWFWDIGQNPNTVGGPIIASIRDGAGNALVNAQANAGRLAIPTDIIDPVVDVEFINPHPTVNVPRFMLAWDIGAET